MSVLCTSGLGIARLLTVIVLFIIVLFLAVFSTRLAGRLQKGQLKNKNIKAIETFHIAPERYIQIVEVGGRILVLGITKSSVNLLCELDGDDIKESLEKDCGDGFFGAAAKESFSKVLGEIKEKMKARSGK